MPTDIPTELLRALVAVVDFRSYGKAGRFLGLAQPSVSSQIKRLQEIVGADLFDKTGKDVKLTPSGELVLSHARRILAINDQLLHRLRPASPLRALRIGVPSDLVHSMFPTVVAEFHEHSPGIRFHFRLDISENLLIDLRRHELDLAIALTLSVPALEARHYWPEEVVWVRSPATNYDPTRPVPLVSYTEDCVYSRLASSALNRACRDYEVVFTGTDIVSLTMAVAAGLGVMVLARRAVPPDLVVWNDAPLPKLNDLLCGIYLREGEDHDMLERLADDVAGLIKPKPAFDVDIP